MSQKIRYDRSDIRRLNAVSVLNQLRLHGALSRGNIAVRLGLTRATVSNIVTDLLNSSLVKETEYVEGAIGRPGLLLQLNPDYGCMVAVEIDLDRISILLADIGQETLWREEVDLPADISPEECLSKAAKLIEKALKLGKKKSLKCLGIGAAWAGMINREEGELAYGPISGWEHVPLKEKWEAQFEVPVYLENEAHAAAIGAHHFSKNLDVNNLIYLSLGGGLSGRYFCRRRFVARC